MGLIKAITGAVGGTFADQWKEFFYCESISKDILVVKGQKQISGRSSNTKGNDNIISNGSGIAVADGQCMIIVEQGKIVEFCAEPGEFTYDSSTEPSLFAGNLGQSIINTFKTMGKRFTFGGDTAKDQRVYYFNTKEILDNKFGTPNPIPFRVVDSKIGLDIDMSLRCSGIYSYRIMDPILFYTNVCGNVSSEYRRDEIDSQLKTEFIDALAPGIAALSNLELRPNQISLHTTELKDSINSQLISKWAELRGLTVVNIALNPPVLTDEDQKLLRDAQRVANPALAASRIIDAQANAMETAAGNPNGAMAGFMGMGMSMNMAGNTAANLYGMAGSNDQQAGSASDNGWKCTCGATATGKFCQECGAKKPEANGWTCTCGAVNQGKFCQECGAKKPADAPIYKCDKCGWQPEDPKNPPKFCPQCGDPFNDDDII